MSSNPLGNASSFPFPGLRPFRREESDIFFGRDKQIDQLLEKLEGERFLAVVGPSGCGKSSLVRAGMIAALETGFMVSAGARWRIAEMRPGTRPLAGLAGALANPSALGPERSTTPQAEPLIGALLRRGPLGLMEILRETPMPPRTNLLILVDQFEEVFRYRMRGGSDEADAFVALLLATAAQREFPVYVVLTMRSDFLGDCGVFPGLPEAINSSQFLTPRLSREEREEAITRPAENFGGEIEPAAVNCLLNDSGSDPDQLPLLQHLLMRLWRRASERRTSDSESVHVTLADYHEVGGLAQCLSRHADEAFLGLSPQQQSLAEVLFRALCERGINRRDTRRPVELGAVVKIGRAPKKELAEVVEAFRRQDRSFLTPPVGVLLEEETVLDISHESLIRRWDRLNRWAEQEAKSADIYRRLAQTAALWEKGQAALWSTPDLENALAWSEREQPTAEWATRYAPGFQTAMEFLAESKAKHEEKLVREEKAKSEAFKKRWLVSYAAVGSFVAVMFGLWMGLTAWRTKTESGAQLASARAESAKQLALASNTMISARVESAKQLAAASNTVAEALQRAKNIKQSASNQVDQVRKEIKRALQEKDSVLVKTLNTGAKETSAVNEVLSAAAYYAAARELESTKPKTNYLDWSFLISQPPPRVRYGGLISGIPAATAMAFCHEGTSLAMLSKEGTVRILEATTGKELSHFLVGTNMSLASFDNDGDRLLVVLQETNALVWAVASAGRSALTNCAADDKITAAAFGSEGDLLALGMESGAVNLYKEKPLDPARGTSTNGSDETARSVPAPWQLYHKAVPPGKAESGPVTALAFSADKGLLIVCGKSARWVSLNRGFGMRGLTLPDLESDLISARFSPDGRFLTGLGKGFWNRWINWEVADRTWTNDATSSIAETASIASGNADGQIKNPLTTPPLALPPKEQTKVFDWDYESIRDSQMLSEDSNSGVFWQMRPAKNVTEQQGPPVPGIFPVFSPSGEFAVAGSGPFLAISFFGQERAQSRRERLKIRAHSEPILAIAVSPDGSLVASASSDGTIRFWEVESREAMAKAKADFVNATCLTFSPSEKLLAAGTSYGTVFCWDIETGATVLRVPAHSEPVGFVRFSPDEQVVLSSDGRTSSMLWRLGDSSPIKFPEPLGPLSAFSWGGELLGEASAKRAQVWTWLTQELVASTNIVRNGISGILSKRYSPRISFTPKGDALRLPLARELGLDWDCWYFRSGRKVIAPNGGIASGWSLLGFSLDGRLQAEQAAEKGQQTIRIRDAFTGSSTSLTCDFDLGSFAFSRRGGFFVAASSDGELSRWDLSGQSEKKNITTPFRVRDVAITEDGERVAIATLDNGVRIWNVQTEEEVGSRGAQSWLPTDSAAARRFTGLVLEDLTPVPISSEESEQQFGSGTTNRPNPALADYWRAWRRTLVQAKEFGDTRHALNLADRLPVLPLETWLDTHTNHAMSGTAQQVVKDVKESLANDFCAKGFQLYKGNSFSNALSCFCRGVQMDHQCAKAYAGLGLVYEKLRPDDQVLAETYFTQCRNLDSDGQVARDFVQDGRNVLEAEDPEGALAWLGPAIGVGPQVAEAYLWRGVAHLQMTNTDRGNEDLARAKDYGVSIGMSEDLQEEALRLRSSKPPKLGLALSCLTASIFLNPGAGAYNLRNTCYYRRGDWDRAIADCDSAIALAPSNAIYFCNRAAAYLAKGETNAALADYNRSIAVEPGNEWGWESRGNYYSRRQPTNALADYTEAIRISPNKVNLYNERGTAHFWKQDWDLAIADYSTFLSRVATDATVLDNRGAAYASKGETNQALADFNNAIELEPRNADTRKMRGDFYVGLKDYVRAVGDYSAAIDLQPTNAALYTVRGKAYLEEGDWPQAIINFNEAISRDTNNPDAYFWRAITYRNQREWAKALRDFDHRIAMSTNANDLVQRGRIYRAVGDSEKARADFSKAEALCDPAHDLVTLAFARAFQGRFAEALADFQRAIAAAPNDPEQLVYLARFYAIRAGSHAKGKKEERASRGDVESALLTLERLFRDKGYKTWSRSMAAMDFEILQNEPRFRAITRPP